MILTDTILKERISEMFDFNKSENVTEAEILTQINPNSIDLT